MASKAEIQRDLSQIDPDHRDFAPKEDNKKQIH